MLPGPTAILVPSLWRPMSLERMINNIRDTTPEEHAIYCVVDEADPASQQVCREYEVEFWTDQAGYFVPRIQFLFEHTREPWFFTGSDDVIYNDGWLTEAFAVADDSIKVICGDDLRNPKGTNFLVNREYVMEHGGNFDTPGRVHYHEYLHNYSDDEMVSTAIYRGVYARAPKSRVESCHPTYGTAQLDDTYFRMYNANSQDEAVYLARRHLWGGGDLWRSDPKWQCQPA
jgi:hypothetical protein